ncbi:MAG: sigma-E factor negative regulatory protein [Exilibacterium sp.]
MTENAAKHVLRESLSALVDDQASELELHRILKESESSSEIRATWARYQLVSAALKGETPSGEYVDLSSRISDAIAGESPLHQVDREGVAGAAHQGKKWWGSVGRFAIAASVAGAVVMVAQQINVSGGGGLEAEVAGGEAVQADHTPAVQTPLHARTVSTQDDGPVRPAQGQTVNFVPRTPEQRIPNEIIQRRLNQLMLEHAEHAAQNSGRGMLPFARIPRVDEE